MDLRTLPSRYERAFAASPAMVSMTVRIDGRIYLVARDVAAGPFPTTESAWEACDAGILDRIRELGTDKVVA